VARTAGRRVLGEDGGTSLHGARVRSEVGPPLASPQPTQEKGARLQQPSSDQASRLRSAERRFYLGQLGDIKALIDEVGER